MLNPSYRFVSVCLGRLPGCYACLPCLAAMPGCYAWLLCVPAVYVAVRAEVQCTLCVPVAKQFMVTTAGVSLFLNVACVSMRCSPDLVMVAAEPKE